ncbi:FG-nucleoporin nsp1 [Friedmanniomyces endolithicus]|nr:FG-nucleoporin nsp1 [Friedmanniomyces endolithicus]
MVAHFHRRLRHMPPHPVGDGRTQARREADRDKAAAAEANNASNPNSDNDSGQPKASTPSKARSVLDSPEYYPQPTPDPNNLFYNLSEQSVDGVKVPSASDLLEQARRDVAAHAAAEEAAQVTTPYVQSAQVERLLRRGFAEPGQSVTMQNTGASLGFGQPPASSGGTVGGGATGTAAAGGGLFGSATPTSTAGSLFGNSTAQGLGGFGGKAPASTGAAQGMFGAPATSGGQQKPLFGAVTGGTGGLFSGNSTPTTSGFGGAAQAATTQQPSGGSLFGNMTTASPAATPGEQPKMTGTSLFGKSATTGGGLFGASPTQAQPAWGFGQTPTSNAGEQSKPAGAQSIFATAPTTSAAPSGQGLFGSMTPQANKTAQPSTTPAGNPPSSLFGTQANKQAENQQPATTQPAQQSAGLFQVPDAPASTTSSSSLFPAQGSSQPGFLPKTATQGQSSSAAPASTTSNLFGNNAAPASTTSLFSNLNQTPAATAAAPATTASSMFAGLGQSQNAPATSSAPPSATTNTSSNLFGGMNFPSSAASSSAPTQPATTTTAVPASAFSGFSLGNQTPSSGAAQPTAASAPPPAFGLNVQAPASNTTASSTTAPAATTTQPSVPAPSLFNRSTAAGPTTSTSGPAPPQQSRLASKTMDEILTTWSTSLATHQKTFQQLATRVSAWDRMLVENSGKISTLYGRCFQAERDCSEVERQLNGVEQGQIELEALLNRYEGEVDGMMDAAGLGDGGQGAGGVDGERERTYKTAEACSSRLTDMHHSLTDMIEEINSASSKLGSGSSQQQQQAQQSQGQTNGSGDPLADIVRVLNSHLAQLQAIDAGASDLQGRVVAAQKEARGLGESSGRGQSWVEGFGKSYLGRR